MRIAIIAWGSLIWCPRDLQLSTKWRSDGPLLPIEYARKSKHNRVTLVLVPWEWVDRSGSYWAHSCHTVLPEACDNLKTREGALARDIHFATLEESGSFGGETPHPDSADVFETVQAWIATQRRVDAAVWTGLPHKEFPRTRETELAADVVSYLRGLGGEARDRAKEYVRYTPQSVRTPVRVAIERDLGWTPMPLPGHLFSGGGRPASRFMKLFFPKRD